MTVQEIFERFHSVTIRYCVDSGYLAVIVSTDGSELAGETATSIEEALENLHLELDRWDEKTLWRFE